MLSVIIADPRFGTAVGADAARPGAGRDLWPHQLKCSSPTPDRATTRRRSRISPAATSCRRRAARPRLHAAADVARAPWLLFLRPGSCSTLPGSGRCASFVERPVRDFHAAVFRRALPAQSALREAMALVAAPRCAASAGARPRHRGGFLSPESAAIPSGGRPGTRSSPPHRPAPPCKILDSGISGLDTDSVKYHPRLLQCREAQIEEALERSRAGKRPRWRTGRRQRSREGSGGGSGTPRSHRAGCAASTASTRGRSACCARPISTAPIRSPKRACSTRSRSSGAPTASEIGRALDLDAGYLSRMLRNFEKRGLIAAQGFGERRPAKPSGADRRAARKAFMPLDRRSQRDTAAMLGRLAPADAGAADRGDEHDRELLGAAPPENRRRSAAIVCARRGTGDFGWIVKRHAELYAQEYGWVEPFEGVCAQIVADFVNKYDRKARALLDRRDGRRECRHGDAGEGWRGRLRACACCWSSRKRAGSASARGSPTNAFASPARAGYQKITLWTHSVLTAARQIYQKAGFKLMRSEQHQSWGQPGRERALGFGVVGGACIPGTARAR